LSDVSYSEKVPKRAKSERLLARAHLGEHMGRAKRGFSFDIQSPADGVSLPAQKEKKVRKGQD
jgi:hypothetical protein